MKIRLLLAVLLALSPMNRGAQDLISLAIIVNAASPLREINQKQLEAIYRLELHKLPGGVQVNPIMMDATKPEMRIILAKIYKMDRDDLERFWMGKIFSGEMVSLPNTVAGTAVMIKSVGADFKAIGFVRTGSENTTVRVVKIDGKLPGDPGYLLISN